MEMGASAGKKTIWKSSCLSLEDFWASIPFQDSLFPTEEGACEMLIHF